MPTVGAIRPSREGSLPASGIILSFLLNDFFAEVGFRVAGASLLDAVIEEASESISSLDDDELVRKLFGSSLVSILDLLGAARLDIKRGFADCFAFVTDNVRLAPKDNVPCLREVCPFDLEEDIVARNKRVKYKFISTK